jgi:HlyD family secretion protein
VDAYPGQSFEGQIRQVRKAASNVANVVTYVAVVGFSNTEGRLLPGMTANVRVVTEERADVLKLPNAALRMRIAGVEPAERAKAPAGAASGGGARGRIYLLGADGKPHALAVRLGVSDGSMTELLADADAPAELVAGAEVIVGTKSAPGSAAKPAGAGPRPPF